MRIQSREYSLIFVVSCEVCSHDARARALLGVTVRERCVSSIGRNWPLAGPWCGSLILVILVCDGRLSCQIAARLVAFFCAFFHTRCGWTP